MADINAADPMCHEVANRVIDKIGHRSGAQLGHSAFGHIIVIGGTWNIMLAPSPKFSDMYLEYLSSSPVSIWDVSAFRARPTKIQVAVSADLKGAPIWDIDSWVHALTKVINNEIDMQIDENLRGKSITVEKGWQTHD
jgi:hypothetical protein